MSSTRSSRGNPSIGDIIRSMVVIGAIILALFGIAAVSDGLDGYLAKLPEIVALAKKHDERFDQLVQLLDVVDRQLGFVGVAIGQADALGIAAPQRVAALVAEIRAHDRKHAP